MVVSYQQVALFQCLIDDACGVEGVKPLATVLQHQNRSAIGNRWNGGAVAQLPWSKAPKATPGRVCHLMSPLIAGGFLLL